MKALFTFQELAKIFTQVVKVEETSKKFAEANSEYTEKDAAFNAEFCKYGCTFLGAPPKLRNMFEEKEALYRKATKAETQAFKSIKKFGEMIGIDEGNYLDVSEDYIRGFLQSKYHWKAPEMVEKVKFLALKASRKIMFN